VFVGEVTIREMSDVELERGPDEFTGLALWPLWTVDSDHAPSEPPAS
jgi:hypothetical protein